ncbi:hypothetical protein B0I00_2036 [Novosphingobium kunmingense]|uniref:Uncharacterized protein n=1 Tax=Novosphingobium kunmingense TaxID=1211806 RepID=A0A2N0H673_9SPHN|nr:hypothetical protein [Novosphingobium kunmingense]PKB14448.1 hypothetical protein B0I00_2036 [Novosphingobium kunmingense]
MNEDNRIECESEYVPSLPDALDDPEKVSVRLDIVVNGGALNFVLVDTTAWPPGSDKSAVGKDAAGNICLVVEKGRDREFTLELSPDWRWTFDPRGNPAGAPLTYKRGNPRLYRVSNIADRSLTIDAKARPDAPKDGAEDFFNIYLLFEQDSGVPIPVRLDPITQNPPPNSN